MKDNPRFFALIRMQQKCNTLWRQVGYDICAKGKGRTRLYQNYSLLQVLDAPLGLLSCAAKKVTKEGGIGEGLSDALPRTNRPSPMYPSCASPVVRYKVSVHNFALCILHS